MVLKTIEFLCFQQNWIHDLRDVVLTVTRLDHSRHRAMICMANATCAHKKKGIYTPAAIPPRPLLSVNDSSGSQQRDERESGTSVCPVFNAVALKKLVTQEWTAFPI